MTTFRLPLLLLAAAALCAQASQAGPPRAPLALRAVGYRGGALLVTGPGVALTHVAPGQVLPIRLSRLAPPPDPRHPPLEGAEQPGTVRYGQLQFLAVAAGSVTFRALLREPDGSPGPARTLTLQLGDSVDLDGDGQPDLALRYPVRPLGVGTLAVPYALLAFPCDRSHTSMFALGSRDCPGGHYPSGISGVTPGGRFIFQSDCLPGPAANAAGRLEGPAFPVLPAPGDVLVDTGTGRFGRIERIGRSGGRWSYEFSEPRSPFLFTKVFGAAHVEVAGDLAELAATARPVAWNGTLLDVDLDQVLMDNDDGRVDLQVAAHLTAGVDLATTITYHGAAARLDLRLAGMLRLAIKGRTNRPWKLEFPDWTLADPKLGFAVDGVPIIFSLPVTAGLAMGSRCDGELLEGIQAEGSWGWSGSLGASWDWDGIQVNAPAPVARTQVTCRGLAEAHLRMRGGGDLRPWVKVSPSLGIATLLTGSCPGTLALDGSFTGEAADARLALEARASFGAEFSLDLPLLGPAWKHSWPLFDWSAPLGAVNLPAALTAPGATAL